MTFYYPNYGYEEKIYNFGKLEQIHDNEFITIEETLTKVHEYTTINCSQTICIIKLTYRLNSKSDEVEVLEYKGDQGLYYGNYYIEDRKKIIKNRIQKYNETYYPDKKFNIKIDEEVIKI